MAIEDLRIATNDELIDELNYCGYDSSFGKYRDNIITEIKKRMKEPVLDNIRTEIEQIEINGHIRDVECFRAGINAALNVIDKYKESNG